MDGFRVQIARSCELRSWPSSEVLAQLVELSSGLFIFAATIAYFIEDRKGSNPNRQLRIVLSGGSGMSTAAPPNLSLDALYLSMLRKAFPEISEDQRASLQVALGTVVLLFDRLEPESPEALLGLEGAVRWMLRDLHSNHHRSRRRGRPHWTYAFIISRISHRC
jgi:hypothetical protein